MLAFLNMRPCGKNMKLGKKGLVSWRTLVILVVGGVDRSLGLAGGYSSLTGELQAPCLRSGNGVSNGCPRVTSGSPHTCAHISTCTHMA